MKLTNIAQIACPQCGVEIPVGADIEIVAGDVHEHDGRKSQGVTLVPDLTDVWAHAWSCAGEATA